MLSLREFKELTKRTIPIRHVSEKYGEYLVAQKLLENGFSNVSVQRSGADIIVDDKKIEVKTSRWTPRFKKGKHGYGWVVPERQWKDNYFDFLVCVASDKDSENMLVFTQKEVAKDFSLSNFTWIQSGEKTRNGKRLDIIEGGEEGLEKHFEIAKEAIKWEGTIEEFERKVNRDPDYYFKNYGFERLLNFLRSDF